MKPPPPVLSEEQIFYCQQRGIDKEEAVGLIVNGFCREVATKFTDGICG